MSCSRKYGVIVGAGGLGRTCTDNTESSPCDGWGANTAGSSLHRVAQHDSAPAGLVPLPPMSLQRAGADFLPFLRAGSAVLARTTLLLGTKTIATAVATRCAARCVRSRLGVTLPAFGGVATTVAADLLVSTPISSDQDVYEY